MTNALAALKVNLPAATSDQMKAFDEVAKASDFFPRIQLITKGKYVDTGKIAPGRWGVPHVGGEDIDDLGEKIDVVPFAFRAKAMDVSDREAIVTTYDVEDPEFKRIMAAPKNTGCMWGPTFLVFERSTGKLYEMFMSNKSGRQEAGKMRPFLPSEANKGKPSAASLGIRYKQGKDYGWHVPVITKCSQPFDSLPDGEFLLKEIERFMTQKSGVEKVQEKDEDKDEGASTKRAR